MLQKTVVGIFLVALLMLFGVSPAHASGHYENYVCGYHIETQPVGGDGSYAGTIYGNVTVPNYCRRFVPDVYDYKGVLAVDDYGMAYGIYVAKKSLFGSATDLAIRQCQAAKPFGKCRSVASIIGGALALAWDGVRGTSAWATDEDLDAAKQAALRQCGSSDCQIAYWFTSPRRTTSDDPAMSAHGWLPGKNNALIHQMLARQNIRLYGAWAVAERAAPQIAQHLMFTRSMVSAEDARKYAVDACQSDFKLGRCRVVAEFADGCSAVAWAGEPTQPEFFSGTGATEKASLDAAKAPCFAKYGDRCEISRSVCSGVSYGQFPTRYLDLSRDERAALLKN
ncbi:MAG: DUF4189 domain-containing protein [Proteobacteria bacterium]|nr:DUF4189 domain-containing protein [Pseudomonadota bacterium]